MRLTKAAAPGGVSRRTLLCGTALGLAAVSLSHPAIAGASYPSRPVRIVVPYAPGGAVDTLARRMAQKLTDRLGQTFIVENKSGATGTIGTAEVARSAPDGLTLLALDNTYATLPYLFNNLPFDHATAFTPVTLTAVSPVVLVVGAKSPYPDLAEFIAAAKRKPETLSFGSGGVGSSLHLSAVALQQLTDIKLFHVPYKGGGEAVRATLSNEVDCCLTSLGSSLSGIQSGLLRALAICGEHRAEALPDVPTFHEAIRRRFDLVNWSGLAAPRGTPPEIIDTLYKAMASSLKDEDMVQFLHSLASTPGGIPPEAFAQMIKREAELWGSVAQRAGIERQ